jgi:hypothetical protein
MKRHTEGVLDWLPAARDALNADDALRRIGSADFRLALVAGPTARLVTFEAFGIADVSEADPADLRDADLVVDMAPDAWRDYLAARGRGDGPSLLGLDLNARVVRAPDPVRGLLFERYNRSIQALIDHGACALAAPR